MSNSNSFSELFERFKIDAPGYRIQLVQLLSELGPTCGMTAAEIERRFAWSEELVAAADVDKGGLLQLADSLGLAVPQLWQLELTHGGTGLPPSLGLVMQGQRGATLADNVNNTLAAAVKLHLRAGGTKESAHRLADFFRTALPNVPGLAKYSATALVCWIRIELCQDPPAVAIFVSPMVTPGFDRDRMRALCELGGAPFAELWPVYNGMDATLLGFGLEPKARRSWLHLESSFDALPTTVRAIVDALKGDGSQFQNVGEEMRALLDQIGPAPFRSRCRVSLRHDLNGDLALETVVLLREGCDHAETLRKLHAAAPPKSFSDELLEALTAHCNRASQIKAGMIKSPMHFIGLHWSAAGHAVVLGPQSVL